MAPQTSSQFDPRTDRSAVHGLRYQVKDVTAVKFYTTHPGFTLKHQQLPAFANLSRRNGRRSWRAWSVRIAATAK
jgi:hypothetical protein